jgi:hypothetical protein
MLPAVGIMVVGMVVRVVIVMGMIVGMRSAHTAQLSGFLLEFCSTD